MSQIQTLRRRLVINPVLLKEVKERARSPRATAILVIFLACMAGIMYLTYRIVRTTLEATGSASASEAFAAPILGRFLFEVLLMVLLGFVGVITPALAAASIVGERERRTLHLLQVTLLKPHSIVIGKLGASVSFVMLLVIATAPIFAVPLVLGGVSPWQVLRGLLVVAAVAIFVASLGIWMSSIARRTQFATVAAYGLVLAYFFGTMFFTLGEFVYQQARPGPSPALKSVYLNPIFAASTAIASNAGTNGDLLTSPFSSLGVVLSEQANSSQRQSSGAQPSTGSSGGLSPVVTAPRPPSITPIWVGHVLLILGASALMIFLASKQVRAPGPKFTLLTKGKR